MRNKTYFGGVSPYRQTDDKGSSNTEPVGSTELVVRPMDEILTRQQFKESEFNSSAVSSEGATSIAQITKGTFEDGLKKGYVPKGTKYEDLAKDDALATQFQRAQMNDLLTRDWNKGNEGVRMAKALAAYNMGASRLVGVLNKMKADGYDIYESLDWVEDLPKYHKYRKGPNKGQPIYESKDYVKKILFGDDEKRYIEISSDKSKIDTLSFEDRYQRAYDAKFGGVSPFQQDDEFEQKVEDVKGYYTDLYKGSKSKERAEKIYGDKASEILEKKQGLVGGVSVQESGLDRDVLGEKDIEEWIDPTINKIFSTYQLTESDKHAFFNRANPRHKEVVDKLNSKLKPSEFRELSYVLGILDSSAKGGGRSYYNRGDNTAVIGSYRLGLMGLSPESAIANEIAHATGAGRAPNKEDSGVYQGQDRGSYIRPYTSPAHGGEEAASLSRQEAGRIYDNLKPGVLGKKDLAQGVHHQRAYEIASDIQTLRYDLYRLGVYNPAEEDFTQAHLNKAREIYKNDPGKIAKLKQLESIMDDGGLIDTMNYLVKNDTGSGDIIGGVGNPRQA